ncbi:GNAT family N-acetyltransferase [Lactobacillus gigeriorum]|uniref:Acetyltransferase n=1 Tax=Lactobacillus gigeriorum DSM 23908 = CRBIP 24.85 TaxID=1423751 RepID=I7LCX3_9LACO|nr:GNAT family N-acetyltransferase [Lactobacillus gigeriorum]KRN12288.1 acetyltransferase [Lactobacillus gigeriorum DSM 23908 = CRBIP 24.85]CCI86866.1 Acetyltransferase [Lactobacillus gigeriorum DSM 23908 = CRBIP 24.85]
MDFRLFSKIKLAGQRIYLRPFKRGDETTLLKWGKNEHYHQTAGFERINNIEEAKMVLHQYSLRQRSYAICLQENRQVIGLVELYERGMENQELLASKEVGFMLDQKYEGQGLMTEALKLVFNYEFTEDGQEEIWAGTFENNLKAQGLLKRLGFTYVYSVDYRNLSELFPYEGKYYLLKKTEWLKIEQNTKS